MERNKDYNAVLDTASQDGNLSFESDSEDESSSESITRPGEENRDLSTKPYDPRPFKIYCIKSKKLIVTVRLSFL